MFQLAVAYFIALFYAVMAFHRGKSRGIDPFEEKETKAEKLNDSLLGSLDSFVLISNNMIGPGMMGLPLLFHDAGLVPTVICIVFIACCAGLCGTMFAETISLIPGNSQFAMAVEYPTAFRIILS